MKMYLNAIYNNDDYDDDFRDRSCAPSPEILIKLTPSASSTTAIKNVIVFP